MDEAISPLDFVLPWDDPKVFWACSLRVKAADASSEIIVNLISSVPWWELILNYWMLTPGDRIDIIGLDHYPGTWYFGKYSDWAPLERICAKTLDRHDPCFRKHAVQETGFSTFLPFFHSEENKKVDRDITWSGQEDELTTTISHHHLKSFPSVFTSFMTRASNLASGSRTTSGLSEKIVPKSPVIKALKDA